MNNKAQTEAMDRAGELPMERRAAERRRIKYVSSVVSSVGLGIDGRAAGDLHLEDLRLLAANRSNAAIIGRMGADLEGYESLCQDKDATIAALNRKLECADKAHGHTIDQRDKFHDWADKLAEAIAKHCGVDIGEHSSANNPWAEALLALDASDAALNQKLARAERALVRGGFVDHGGEEWNPPLGKPPVFIEVPAALNQQLAAARNEALREAADICNAIYQDHRDRYKGRGNWAGCDNPRSTDPHAEGAADGAGDCVTAIRALASHPAAPVQPLGYISKFEREVLEGGAALGLTVFNEARKDRNVAIYAAPPVQQTGDVRDLQADEQYRMQMAAISTAALGYWKESEGIMPEYDTAPLRDVAKLYAKYEALATTQPATLTPAQMWDIASDHLVTRDLDEGPEALIIRTEDELYAAVRAIGKVSGGAGVALTDRAMEFVDAVIEVAFEGGDLDGGSIQEWAEEYGLIKPVTMTEPCSEGQNCRCGDRNDFPLTCYQKTYKRNAILAASGGAHAVPEEEFVAQSVRDWFPDRANQAEYFARAIVTKQLHWTKRHPAAPTQDQGEGNA